MGIVERIFRVMIIGLLVMSQSQAYALPTGQSLISGSGTFDTATSGELHINQASNQMIVNYNSFNIAQNELVQFHQPSASSIALNRVVGGSPSEILGRLSANGQVFLINPNGVLFGPTACVDVHGLVASNMNITDDDFLAGRYTFTGQNGAVINQGFISAPGGYVALIGSGVINSGSIEANLGSVALAAGDVVTLNLDAQGIVNVAVKDPAIFNTPGDAAVNNLGTLKAQGGKVILTAKALNSVFDNAINNDGIIEATVISEQNGKVLITGDSDVHVGGTINGGDVSVESTDGNVVHKYMGVINTHGGDFVGKAAKDYTLNNGASIEVGAGNVDILAGENIYLGADAKESVYSYTWSYVSSDRGYKFTDFGYYAMFGGVVIYVSISKGSDIGKDGTSATSGTGYLITGAFDPKLYGSFMDDAKVSRTYHEDIALNPDAVQHVQLIGDDYGFEDMLGGGDKDYNDAIVTIDFEKMEVLAHGSIHSENNVFLTAEKGAIYQTGGSLQADNLMLATATGMKGVASNGGLLVEANNVSAVNLNSGNISLEDKDGFNVADLRGTVGLNKGVMGSNGIKNVADSGEINLVSGANLDIKAQVKGLSNIYITAAGNIVQHEGGDVTIVRNDNYYWGAPENVHSTSHTADTWQYGVSNDNTIDMQWELSDMVEGPTVPVYTAVAGGAYTMFAGTKVKTNGGDVDITANRDVALALVDAGSGVVNVTTNTGNIVDADLGVAPTDLDVIARKIHLSAPAGSVGSDSEEGEIDLGAPDVAFSYLWDTNASSDPDDSSDPYTAAYNTKIDAWVFSTTSVPLADSTDWNFHVKALYVESLSSTEHAGAYYIDTTKPVVSEGAATGIKGNNGWWRSDVTVPFSATDNLSGLNPAGDLSVALDSKTTSGEGVGLKVASDGVCDRAGNCASGVSGAFNIDWTAPVITAGTPIGTKNADGTYASDITVPFSATDNLSGVAPSGALATALASGFIPGPGTGLTTSSGDVVDMAGNVAPAIKVGPFDINNNPQPQPEVLVDAQAPLLRVYYEVLNPRQLSVFEPVQPLGVYFYHPLAKVDQGALNEVDLSTDAFGYIDDMLKKKENEVK